MRGGRFLNSLRHLARQPVINTPLIRNAFELGHCVSKPIKQGCMSPPSKEKQYFLIGLSSSMKQQQASPMKHMSFAAATHVKNSSSSAAAMVDEVEEHLEDKVKEEALAVENVATAKTSPGLEQDKVCGDGGISAGYWGVSWIKPEDTRSKIWNSFRPSETRAIEAEAIEKHRNPENFSDQFARLAVTALRFPTDLLFRPRYLCRASMLETISGVPGMVGGMILHCKSLRRVEHSGGWIKALMEEAENERMHLMTFMELFKPSWQERLLVFAAQGMFMNAYIFLYVVSPRFAHRMAGCLKEEMIRSYNQLINDIDEGKIENPPAPDIAIDYWRLPPDATLRDVLLVIRADEVHHREVNHFAADVFMQGHTLKEAPSSLLSITNSFERTCASPA